MSLQRSTFFRPRLLTAIAAVGTAVALAAGCAGSPAPTSQSSSSSAASSSTASNSAPGGSAADGSGSASGTPAAAPESGNPAAFPVTVTGDNGDVTVAAKPVSIASLSPTATEMLYAIGAGDQVTVVDNFSDYPKDLPDARVDAYQLNVEALTAYQPDLVITSGASPDQEAKFKALGMTMLVQTAPADLTGTFTQIETLGRATGHVVEADALVTKLKAQVADIVAQLPNTGRPLTYYYELDQTYYSVTSDTFVGSVLAQLGLKSIADDAEGAAAAGGYPQLSAEFILKANPDYILLTDTVCCQQSAASVAARDGWSALSAVADGRVVELNDSVASRWGPRIVDLMQSVLTALKEHPVAP
jgi:iron complex transport system substrate-binding protein